MEEENLPLLQGVTPSGYACDLGLSAYADDVAKKVVGRSEKELFEALEFSDKVLDEELEVGGWKRNMDKREVVPTMKGRRPGFDLKQKERGIVAGARPLGSRFTWNGNNREELLCRKRAIRTAWLSIGKFWTVKGHWAKKRIIFGCKVLGTAVSAAETYAWHDSEMKEINSLLCKYMRVMLIPPFSVEVAVRRIGWLKAMLWDEANHAQALAAVFGRFFGRDVLEKDGDLCEGANPFAVAFHRVEYLIEGVTGTEELYEALRKNGFQSLFVSQSEAWEALQRMDTSFLRAACWTMASGMKLEKHVKALCGDDCKVDWCCEILSESGVPCGLRFRSKKALRCHQLRSRSHGHGLQTSIGHCRVDAGAFPWPISTPLSLQCRLCDDGDNYTSVDEFYDHAVAVHLTKPSPVSLPIATALHHACDTRGTRRNTSDEGRDHGRGGEETTTDTSEIGGWGTWFGTTERGRRGKRTGRRGRFRGLQKEARRLLQEHHAVDGHHHQAVPADRTRHAVSLRRPLRHNHHGHGTRRREEHAGADASVQRERTDSWKGAHVGSSSENGLGENSVTLTGYLRQLDGMSMDAKCDHAIFCRVDRTYQSEQARITLSVDRSGVRDAVVSALQQLGAARKFGRAPPTQLSRELQQWLDTLLDK